MALRWLTAPALVLLTGCGALSPTAYRRAAQRLTFTLEAVEPSFHLAFPLERSRVALDLRLQVDNPSKVAFRARSIAGSILLEQGGQNHPIGQLDLAHGLDLPPNTRTPVTINLSFTYGDLAQAWPTLKSVMLQDGTGTWRLEGQAKLETFGIPVTLPLSIQKPAGKP